MQTEVPEIRYARSGDVAIAYWTLGEGPFDLVYVPAFVSSIELEWDNPWRAAVYRELASFCRLIRFDKRGTGLSDRVAGVPNLETRMDDVRAVMDAVGSERAALWGIGEGGPMSILFAATYPERTVALILFGASPRFVWAPDYPWAPTREEAERRIADLERRWGTEEFFDEMFAQWAPSFAEHELYPDARRNFGRVLRSGASPGSAAALNRMNLEIDVRPILSAIRVPTLVMHRTEMSPPPIEAARHLAERIPGARLVEFSGVDQSPFSPSDKDAIFRQLEDFVRESIEAADADEEPDRVLATVLFTDIVDSTVKAVELGDRGWRDLVQRHHDVIRRQLSRFRGQEVDTAGDGFFASFDGPARAIRCAGAITEAVRELGIEVRAGLHTGECEVIDGKVGGIAVHIGARVASQAGAGDVLVSSTVRDLVAGSGIQFSERGLAELKGIPGEWRLFAVESA